MNIFKYKCFNFPKTINQTKKQMRLLNEELADTDMQNLRAFNQTYYIITKNVFSKLYTGFFTDNELLQEIDVRFSHYYFQALKEYVETGSCPPAWKILFEICPKNNLLQFTYMALGVNAHVNNDLPQTLRDVMKGNNDKHDFTVVNDIIRNCLDEVVSSLEEKSLLINTLENTTKHFYEALLMTLIQNWRNYAWDTYLKLQKNLTSIGAIESKAQANANKIVTIRSIFDASQVLNGIYMNPRFCR